MKHVFLTFCKTHFSMFSHLFSVVNDCNAVWKDESVSDTILAGSKFHSWIDKATEEFSYILVLAKIGFIFCRFLLYLWLLCCWRFSEIIFCLVWYWWSILCLCKWFFQVFTKMCHEAGDGPLLLGSRFLLLKQSVYFAIYTARIIFYQNVKVTCSFLCCDVGKVRLEAK